MMEWNFDLAPS